MSAEVLSTEIHEKARTRLRCPDDDGSTLHLAVDIRQPGSTKEVARLLLAVGTCACGKELVVASSPRIR